MACPRGGDWPGAQSCFAWRSRLPRCLRRSRAPRGRDDQVQPRWEGARTKRSSSSRSSSPPHETRSRAGSVKTRILDCEEGGLATEVRQDVALQLALERSGPYARTLANAYSAETLRVQRRGDKDTLGPFVRLEGEDHLDSPNQEPHLALERHLRGIIGRPCFGLHRLE